MRQTDVFQSAMLEQWAQANLVDPTSLRSFRRAFFRDGSRVEACCEILKCEPAEVSMRAVELAGRADSVIDGATKLAFRLVEHPVSLVETVILRIASGRTTVCVSSQVGCAAGCTFCATGTMGLKRNLSAREIVDQVVQANRLLAQENAANREASERHGAAPLVRNVVFMGMGEPLHNEDAVHEAIAILTDSRMCNLHSKRLLVSTVGVPDAMVRLVERFPEVGLAVSLHSAVEGVRREIVPLAVKHDSGSLRDAMVRVNEIQSASGKPVMIEYLMLDGVNDDLSRDVDALAEYLRGLRVHVNLIPYNEVEGMRGNGLRGSDEAKRRAFADALKARGFKVTVRYSLGRDIAAACGQLAVISCGH